MVNRIWPIFGSAVLCCMLLVPMAAAEVRVYYFHSTTRCDECLAIEQMTEEILKENFPQQLANGRLTWRPTNADLPENTHFVFDYDLAANELVVARDTPVRTTAWKKLPETWNLAHDPEKFRKELVDIVTQALVLAD